MKRSGGWKFEKQPSYRSRPPAGVADVLKKALRRHGLDREIDRYRFVLHWRDIMGESAGKRTRPESLRNGLLRISVPDSSWAQELSFYKDVIISRLQKYLDGKEAVRDVKFYVSGKLMQ